ncbi:ferritin [Rhodococcoides fascians A21d2]|uniref:ferritin n=1 Tax=Nocardiaceae TaxID=85025 RepID=UPI0005671883|nr:MULTISPECIES: ferritin [Rhodococcus]OZC49713.1 bacterioferritin [Rhodococcus sp. WWJCD1]OZE81458.1 bacterioferritin [Rhodococcus sp. 15-649-2-2]QIH98763.1 ferritin [Rhodococcus fascians A21d2]QII04252.1 ferritin [Rhodococcus fascians A25f]
MTLPSAQPAVTPGASFHDLLRAQVRHEFTASQQYVAIAVWFDRNDLPQLATRFYAQSAEERRHAMMMIRFLIDNRLDVDASSIGDVVTAFESVVEPVELALAQETTVTEQITALARAARAEGDYIGEQFTHWFLTEQVEEVAAMQSLLNIVRRAESNLFDIEQYVAREIGGSVIRATNAPKEAGSA